LELPPPHAQPAARELAAAPDLAPRRAGDLRLLRAAAQRAGARAARRTGAGQRTSRGSASGRMIMDLTSASLFLALFGPPAVGIGAPLASWLVLWKRRRTLRGSGERSVHPVRSIVVVLLAWCALAIAAVILFQDLGFAYAWGWAHARGVPSPRGPGALLLMELGGLLLMCGSALALHRFIAHRYAACLRASQELR